MALRARKKPGRQGGSPNRRTQVTGGTGSATFTPAQPRGPAKGLTPADTRKQVVGPNAAYSSVAPAARTPAVPNRTAGSEALRANAAQGWTQAQTSNRDSIFRALMNLGDTSLFSKYQSDPNFAGYQFAQDPNSLFATLARQEAEGLENIDVNANAGNTFFSGQRLGNREKLTDESGRQRLAGSTSFNDDLKAFAAALAGAQGDYELALGEADQMDIDAMLAAEREDAGPTPVQQTAQANFNTDRDQQRAAQEFADRQAKARARQRAAEEEARRRARKKKKR